MPRNNELNIKRCEKKISKIASLFPKSNSYQRKVKNQENVNSSKIMQKNFQFQKLQQQTQLILDYLNKYIFQGLPIQYEIFEFTIKYLIKNIIQDPILYNISFAPTIKQDLANQIKLINICGNDLAYRVLERIEQNPLMSQDHQLDQYSVQQTYIINQNLTQPAVSTSIMQSDIIQLDQTCKITSIEWDLRTQHVTKDVQNVSNLIKHVNVQEIIDNAQKIKELFIKYQQWQQKCHQIFVIKKTLIHAGYIIQQLSDYQQNGLFKHCHRPVFLNPIKQTYQQISQSKKYALEIQKLLIKQRCNLYEVMKNLVEAKTIYIIQEQK